LNPAKQTLLANAVLAQCDTLDGVADGIVSKPAACNYDPAPLRCAGGTDTGDSCLSDAQIDTVKTITSAVATSDNAWSHPGYNFGLENTAEGWGSYIWPQAALGGNSVQGMFSDGFVRSFITQDPAFDTLTWNPDQWLARMGVIGGLFSAADPDLGRLHARGAKLIMWNGTNDTSVSARDTSRYYDNVVSTLGQQKADETVELFLAPGVGHCYGGPGADKVDLLKAMSTWVEQGVPASAQKLVQRKVDAASGATALSRPMCKYPAYPRYKGTRRRERRGQLRLRELRPCREALSDPWAATPRPRIAGRRCTYAAASGRRPSFDGTAPVQVFRRHRGLRQPVARRAAALHRTVGLEQADGRARVRARHPAAAAQPQRRGR
jgi:hypothetical protein